MSEDALLTIREVEAEVRIGHKTIRALRKLGRFPEPIRIGKRRMAWRRSVIEDWKTRGTGVVEVAK